ncbi:Dihydroxyacetone phosphate acyltransferase [Bagarius yarrelli]|uniref:Dihydroxyacetone phosphate acyltransferase n=1 Tax=Bagarius yarrelli TaxID=175774 RepID=A0A556U8T3_BAGYA|nr:Dihydroxyacetone phosphate acyltransferase [Bagarius yarrelli]
MLTFCFDVTSVTTAPFPVCVSTPALMGMSLVGEVLRRSGAFFIRRAIGSDKLYWAVLSEYVRTIVRTGFAPLEFFVEGLRSRTLKSLKPKLGMMQMVLEPFFKGEVYDITLVPISISYDRVLEESLLAHELLGVPKPKETTREFVSDVAHLSVLLQEQGLVLSPWSLMALILLQTPEGVDWNTFTQKTLRLRTLAARLGARIHWPAEISDSDVMSSNMALHQSIVYLENGCVRLVEEAGPGPITQEEELLRRASAVLMCALYRNQALHVFTRPALVAIAMTTASSYGKDDVFSRFCFLQDVLANEFIFMPGHAAQVVFRVLCDEKFLMFTEKSFVPDVRAAIMKLFLSGEVRSYECFSSDTQKNALSALVRIGAASKSMVAGQYEYRINGSAVRRICDTLSEKFSALFKGGLDSFIL